MSYKEDLLIKTKTLKIFQLKKLNLMVISNLNKETFCFGYTIDKLYYHVLPENIIKKNLSIENVFKLLLILK